MVTCVGIEIPVFWSSKLLPSWTAPEKDAVCCPTISVPYVSIHSIMTFHHNHLWEPQMSHYAVFLSFSFVLDTMQARCEEVPWSVVQFRCTQLPKLPVTVTSRHITSLFALLLCIVFYILSLLCNLLLHMSSILSICLNSFISFFIIFFPPIFPPFFPLFFLPCTLSFSLSPTTNTSHASSMYSSI